MRKPALFHISSGGPTYSECSGPQASAVRCTPDWLLKDSGLLGRVREGDLKLRDFCREHRAVFSLMTAQRNYPNPSSQAPTTTRVKTRTL
jgi:hypothetical protein